MKKKISSILLAAILMLSGCNNTSKTEQETTTTAVQTTTAEITTTAVTEPKAESYESRYQLSNPNAKVPRIPVFERDGAMWSWFMIWHTDHITGNSVKVLNNVYNDEKAITLDEIPDIYS